MVIGGHGDKTMIPLSRFASPTTVLPISNLISKSGEIEDVVSSKTMVGGATLNKTY